MVMYRLKDIAGGVGAYLRERLREASTFSGLAFLIYAGDRRAISLAIGCALLAVILSDRKK